MPDTSAPEVSVIIPAYQVSAYIAEAIDSVIAQTFRRHEIIVVNDGAPDTEILESILQRYGDQIRYVRQDNGGPSAARNTGLRLARAPLVAFLDGDDAWRSDYLEVQVAMLRADPSADIVYPNGVIIGNAPLAGRELMEFSPSNGPVTFESVVEVRCTVAYSVVARAEILSRVGGFDESFRRAEDFDLWLRVLKAGGRIVYHRQPLLRYRHTGTSLSSNEVAMREGGLKVLEKAMRTLPLTPAERSAAARAERHFAREVAYLSGKAALHRGDARSALIAFRRMCAIDCTMKTAFTIAMLRFLPTLALRLGRRGWRPAS